MPPFDRQARVIEHISGEISGGTASEFFLSSERRPRHHTERRAGHQRESVAEGRNDPATSPVRDCSAPRPVVCVVVRDARRVAYVQHFADSGGRA